MRAFTPLWTRAVVATVAVALVAGAACGEEDVAPGERHVLWADLVIRFDRDGSGPAQARSARLRCPSESHSGRCKHLRRLPASAFRPVRPGLVCAQVYDGPETAAIRGRIGRQRIDASYSRVDACEIARFDRVEAIVALAR